MTKGKPCGIKPITCQKSGDCKDCQIFLDWLKDLEGKK